MIAPVVKISEKPDKLRQPYLGPVEVIATGRRMLDVQLPTSERVEAELALAYPYKPAVGDTLLVIGNPAGLYVIGVIEGQGKLDMTFQGDVRLHALDGELTLSGDKGVKVQGPLLDVLVDNFNVMAESAVQKFKTLQQRVREVLTLRAGESHTIVDETSLQRAKKYAVVAEETASVNGKQILLG